MVLGGHKVAQLGFLLGAAAPVAGRKELLRYPFVRGNFYYYEGGGGELVGAN